MSTNTIDKPKAASLLRSTGAFALMTFFSRILGFVRDMLIAHAFGASASIDAFWVAFKIPNFMRRLFAEGAFSQAFIPVLAEYQEQRSHEQTREFIARISGTLGAILLIVTVIAMIGSPWLIKVFAPGFSSTGPRYELATALLRITFPYLLLISLTAMAAAVLNTYGSFAVPAFAPLLLNACLIIAAVWGRHWFPVPETALAWGVCVAGVMQLLFLLPFLARKHLLPKPQFAWGAPGVKKVLKLMLPALFGVSVAQINLLIGTLFASFLVSGSISWLYYADRLMNFPLGVFGVAIATVILPHLSRQHADRNPQRFSRALDWGIRTVLLIGIPAALGLTLLAGPMIATLFAHGKFDAADVAHTQECLLAFAAGIPFFMLIKILASGYYAQQDIKTPVKIGAIAMLANIVFNVTLIHPLAHIGLALATSLAAAINAGLLFALLLRRGTFHWQPGWLKFTLQISTASLVLCLWLYFHHTETVQWLHWTAWQRVGRLLTDITIAMIAYLTTLTLTGFPWKSLSSPDVED